MQGARPPTRGSRGGHNTRRARFYNNQDVIIDRARRDYAVRLAAQDFGAITAAFQDITQILSDNLENSAAWTEYALQHPASRALRAALQAHDHWDAVGELPENRFPPAPVPGQPNAKAKAKAGARPPAPAVPAQAGARPPAPAVPAQQKAAAAPAKAAADPAQRPALVLGPAPPNYPPAFRQAFEKRAAAPTGGTPAAPPPDPAASADTAYVAPTAKGKAKVNKAPKEEPKEEPAEADPLGQEAAQASQEVAPETPAPAEVDAILEEQAATAEPAPKDEAPETPAPEELPAAEQAAQQAAQEEPTAEDQAPEAPASEEPAPEVEPLWEADPDHPPSTEPEVAAEGATQGAPGHIDLDPDTSSPEEEVVYTVERAGPPAKRTSLLSRPAALAPGPEVYPEYRVDRRGVWVLHHQAPAIQRTLEELEEEEHLEDDPEIDPHELPRDAWVRPRAYRRSRHSAGTQFFRIDQDEEEGPQPKARTPVSREEAEAQFHRAAFRAGEVVEAEAVEATTSPRGAATKRTAAPTPPHTLPSTPASSSSATVVEPLRVKRRPATPPPNTLFRTSPPARVVRLSAEPLAAEDQEAGPQPVARQRGRTRTPPPAAAASPARSATPQPGRAPEGRGTPILPKGEVAAEGATVQAERPKTPRKNPPVAKSRFKPGPPEHELHRGEPEGEERPPAEAKGVRTKPAPNLENLPRGLPRAPFFAGVPPAPAPVPPPPRRAPLADREPLRIAVDWHKCLDRVYDARSGWHASFLAALERFCYSHKPVRLFVISFTGKARTQEVRDQILDALGRGGVIARILDLNLHPGAAYGAPWTYAVINSRTGQDGKAANLWRQGIHALIDDNRAIIKESKKTGIPCFQVLEPCGPREFLDSLQALSDHFDSCDRAALAVARPLEAWEYVEDTWQR